MAAAEDDGVQIIDITDINNPIAASAVIDGQDNFVALDGARDITITTIDSSTYALVAAKADDESIGGDCNIVCIRDLL